MTADLRTRIRNTVAAWTGIGGGEHVLYISAESLIALRRGADGWQLGARFQLLPEDLQPFAIAPQERAATPVPGEFREWIGRWNGDNFRILIDSADEEIEVDEMPRVRGTDRVKVLDRRLKQRFRDAFLTTWVAPRGGDRTSSRRAREAETASSVAAPSECTMMATLRQRNPMHHWIDAALDAGARVVSIESPALLAARLVDDQGPRPTALVVSVQPAGLRQTLIHNGDIRFTRLLPLSIPAAWKPMANELERTVRFLMMSRAGLRPLIQAGKFPVYLVATGVDEARGTSPIPSGLHLDGEIAVPITRLDERRPSVRGGPASGVTAIGAIPALLRSHARAKRGGYAGAEMRRNWRNGRSLASVWALALSAVVATVSANVAVEYAFSGTSDPVMERQRTARISATHVETDELERRISAMPVNAKEMAGVVELAEQLQSRHVDALATMQWISDGVAIDPALTIDDLSWEPQRSLTAVPAPRPAAAAATPEAAGTLAARRSGVPAAEDAQAAAATTATLVHVAGKVDRSLTKETANRKVGELLARLRASCSCPGKILEEPYDPSMDVAYSNSLRTPVDDHPPHFTLELERPSPWVSASQRTGGETAASIQAPAPAGAPAIPAPAPVSQAGGRNRA